MTYEFDSVNQRLKQWLYEGDGGHEDWQTLIDNVSGMTFTYLDQDGNETDILADIRTVVITMTCKGSYGEGIPRTLTARVRCRNL